MLLKSIEILPYPDRFRTPIGLSIDRIAKIVKFTKRRRDTAGNFLQGVLRTQILLNFVNSGVRNGSENGRKWLRFQLKIGQFDRFRSYVGIRQKQGPKMVKYGRFRPPIDEKGDVWVPFQSICHFFLLDPLSFLTIFAMIWVLGPFSDPNFNKIGQITETTL